MRRPGEQIIKQAYRHLSLQNQAWIESRMAWILGQFGREQIRQTNTVFHCDTDFKENPDEFRQACVDVAATLELDSSNIHYSLNDHERDQDGGFALGLYWSSEGQYYISIDKALLDDPESLLCTLVHELCHVHLLGHGRVSEDEPDHEPLTDLLCVALGYGLVVSKNTLADFCGNVGNLEFWQIQRNGYLTMPMYGYALALLAHLKQEPTENWKPHLRPDVRDAFAKSYSHLQKQGLPDFSLIPDEFGSPDIFSAADSESTYEAGLMQKLYPNDFEADVPEVDEPDFDADHGEEVAENECIYCRAPTVAGEEICPECQSSIDQGREEYEQEQANDGGAAIKLLLGACFIGFVCFVVFSMFEGCTS